MSRVDSIFRELRGRGQKALVPFIVAGDPDLPTTTKILAALPSVGISLAEIGFPYSDPIADGPTIQAAYTRALGHGTRVEEVFSAVRQLEDRGGFAPIAMVSFALVYRMGVRAFAQSAATARLCGLIVPDLPTEEAAELEAACQEHEMALIQLIAPTTSPERAERILRHASGFVYYVSVTGITGARSQLPADLPTRVAQLRGMTDLPICVGFGIRDPDQVRQIAPHVDGVIVGSAVVQRLQDSAARGANRQAAVDDIIEFCDLLQRALHAGSAV